MGRTVNAPAIQRRAAASSGAGSARRPSAICGQFWFEPQAGGDGGLPAGVLSPVQPEGDDLRVVPAPAAQPRGPGGVAEVMRHAARQPRLTFRVERQQKVLPQRRPGGSASPRTVMHRCGIAAAPRPAGRSAPSPCRKVSWRSARSSRDVAARLLEHGDRLQSVPVAQQGGGSCLPPATALPTSTYPARQPGRAAAPPRRSLRTRPGALPTSRSRARRGPHDGATRQRERPRPERPRDDISECLVKRAR